MNKLFTTMLTILACGAAHALPVGNPSDASLLCDGLIWEGHCGDLCDPCLTWCDAFSVRFGFYGDYVFNRHLKVDTNGNNSTIERTTLTTNAGCISANFWDRFDIFGTLGATKIGLATNFSSFGAVAGPRFELATDNHFSWSIGGRGTIWECGCTSLGAEAQYFYTCPKLRRVSVGAVDSIYPSGIDAKYQEWQIGAGISHRINIFVPYVAVKCSGVKLDFDNAIFNFIAPSEIFGRAGLDDLKNKNHFGFAVGVSLVDCEKASLTVEGRFGDERALHINGQIRF